MPQINGKCQVLSLAFCFSVFMALVPIRDMPPLGTSICQPQVSPTCLMSDLSQVGWSPTSFQEHLVHKTRGDKAVGTVPRVQLWTFILSSCP